MWPALHSKTGAAVGKPGHSGRVLSVAYSADGKYIVSGSIDRITRNWDAETDTAVGKPLERHTDWVWSIAYYPKRWHVGSY